MFAREVHEPATPRGPAKALQRARSGRPADTAEAEADHIAEQVVTTSGTGLAKGLRSAAKPVGERAPEELGRVVSGIGAPLPTPVRLEMELRFGYDFSGVRVHADSAAAQSASAVHASAYTAGKSIVFGQGQFAPNTLEGRRLLAHELGHVVQQSASNARIQRKPDPDVATPRLRAPTAATFDNFDHAKAVLKSEHAPLLQSLAQLYFRVGTASPGSVLVLTGHTDLTGDERLNTDLGRKRALEVAAGLMRAGVPADFIRIESVGEREPVVDTPDREPRNRRVEARFEQTPSQFQVPTQPGFTPIAPGKLPPRPGPIFLPGPGPRPTPSPTPKPRGGPAPMPGPHPREREPESTTRPGTPGDIADAFINRPEIKALIDSELNRVQREWDKMKPGEKGATVVVAGAIAAGAFAAILSDPDARAGARDAVDGKSVTVPGVPWLKAQIKTKDPGGTLTIDIMKLLAP